MITINLPAVMKCDHEKGCDKSAPVDLCLLTGGGFAFKPASTEGLGWQLSTLPNGAFTSHCPEHHRVIERAQVGPAGPRIIREVKHGH